MVHVVAPVFSGDESSVLVSVADFSRKQLDALSWGSEEAPYARELRRQIIQYLLVVALV